MPRFLVRIVAAGVVTANESPARVRASILIGAVKEIRMEVDGGAGFHLAIDEFEAFESRLDSLGIGAGLIADGAMIHSA